MSEKTGFWKPITSWFSKNYLWLIGLCLMLASAGIDGVYLMKWQAPGYGVLGQVLNTTADIAGMVITYTYGTLRRSKSEVRRKRATWLLGAEIVAVFYSWLFSWRQLLTVLQSVEPTDYTWMSWLGAAFIPLLLGFLGYAQSLKVDEFADERGEIKPEVVSELRGLLSDAVEQLSILRANFIKEQDGRKTAQANFEKLNTNFGELVRKFNDRPKIRCTKTRYLALLKESNGNGPKSSEIGEHKIFILTKGLGLPTDGSLKDYMVAAGFEVEK